MAASPSIPTTSIIFFYQFEMSDMHIIPMLAVDSERFRAETNTVFYFEGANQPSLDDYGEPGDIFAYREIRREEVKRLLFVKRRGRGNGPAF
jgi:hypothetical protein